MDAIFLQQAQIDLSKFNTGDYNAGPLWKIALWYLVSYLFFDSGLAYPSNFKRNLLILFGAKVGKGIVVKPHVRIKYPWKLSIGENSWLGESVWIENFVDVEIGNNVCVSQGAMLLTGNHDYKVESFPYRFGSIVLEDGVWIGAKSVVCPGVVCESHAILTVNSVTSKTLEAGGVYSGNPATYVRARNMIG
ncbi:putative colanic acid biosynthesis acetyltransferase WcaF [Pontibacter ummariensis]|uniref:Putative colanic acid biosynthesis acetyltransferase WcaF n=1 Tax=Pontibacter ummariensis TaxID=1610492 RepID=A0A239K5F3_9BACT|nr:WcaF family extracellular polysaccharide biosynthesis acetyltransferase [Pontibacter ummariensis]PRY06754.1 putative colanic acid biosynthesis acetyltransferase WcaF [Pontibacter ummariensis]SNT13261.1 putative colanic acid biosynthesis acetyltransferase WcaF [Pontibacter ummariensis]